MQLKNLTIFFSHDTMPMCVFVSGVSQHNKLIKTKIFSWSSSFSFAFTHKNHEEEENEEIKNRRNEIKYHQQCNFLRILFTCCFYLF